MLQIPNSMAIGGKLIQAGKIDMQPMITDSSYIKLEHVQEAFEALVKPSSQLQMIIEP